MPIETAVPPAAKKLKSYDRDGLHKRDGIWYFGWRGADGKWHEQSTRTKNYHEAQEIRDEHKPRLQRTRYSEWARLTFQQAADRWLHEREVDGLAPNTLRIETACLQSLRRFFQEMKLTKVATPRLLSEYRELRKGQVKPRTFNLERKVMMSILKKAKLWMWVEEDFKNLKDDTTPIGRALEPEEEANLLAGAGPFMFHVYLAGRHTGLRKCELLGLTLADIDLVENTVTVRRKTTKTDAGARTIPLNEHARVAFEWLRNRAAGKGSKLAQHYLFPHRDHKKWNGFDAARPQTSFRTAWRRLTRRDDVKLKGLRFHDTRHTFRSDLADNDVDELTAMAVMGHKSREMSEVYTHLRKSAQEKLANSERKAVEAVGKHYESIQRRAAEALAKAAQEGHGSESGKVVPIRPGEKKNPGGNDPESSAAAAAAGD